MPRAALGPKADDVRSMHWKVRTVRSSAQEPGRNGSARKVHMLIGDAHPRPASGREPTSRESHHATLSLTASAASTPATAPSKRHGDEHGGSHPQTEEAHDLLARRLRSARYAVTCSVRYATIRSPSVVSAAVAVAVSVSVIVISGYVGPHSGRCEPCDLRLTSLGVTDPPAMLICSSAMPTPPRPAAAQLEKMAPH